MNRSTAPTGWHLHSQLAEDTHPVARFALSDLQLMDDANHPWLILVPRVENAVEWVDLDESQQAELTREIGRACRALQAVFQPHKLNVAALGNMVPQLHVHVIARFKSDDAWPRPVWGGLPAPPYEAAQAVKRVNDVRGALRLRGVTQGT